MHQEVNAPGGQRTENRNGQRTRRSTAVKNIQGQSKTFKKQLKTFNLSPQVNALGEALLGTRCSSQVGVTIGDGGFTHVAW